MALSKTLTLCIIAAVFISAAATRDRHLDGWFPASSLGLVGDLIAGDEEFEMESEASRRILATTKYISYGALRRNSVPCSRRGASYYNCKPGAQANPYTRGCSSITRCRS